jgi:hypothetical protein
MPAPRYYQTRFEGVKRFWEVSYLIYWAEVISRRYRLRGFPDTLISLTRHPDLH